MIYTIIDDEPLSVPTLEMYWKNPAPFEAEKVEGQAQINALFAPHEARIRAQMEAMWAAEEAGL
ncbi:MAG: hypothetical protein EOO77_19450 [Oxalobacteraceae bacterium]|nr:MAG: hypothetical protein EOO77_19450 [Oxalobacteraceae bacterium]